MLRRGLALGGGLVLLILIVLGVKGCLDARANRELSDYARNVAQIVEETAADEQERSSNGWKTRATPRSPTSSTRSTPTAAPSTPTRPGSTSSAPPATCRRAQANLELTYELRANAMDEIAEKMSTALGDAGAEKAMAGDRQADAEAARLRRRLRTGGAAGSRRRPRRQRDLRLRPAEEHLPAGRKVARREHRQRRPLRRSAAAAPRTSPASTAPNSTGVIVNGTELVEGAPTTIAGEEGVEVEVQVQNQGESTENGVNVAVTYEGNTVKGEIDELPVGETGTALIPLTPTPSGEVTLEVEVEAVPRRGTSTENNEGDLHAAGRIAAAPRALV